MTWKILPTLYFLPVSLISKLPHIMLVFLAGLLVDCCGAGQACAWQCTSFPLLTHGNRDQLDDLATVVQAHYDCSSFTALLSRPYCSCRLQVYN